MASLGGRRVCRVKSWLLCRREYVLIGESTHPCNINDILLASRILACFIREGKCKRKERAAKKGKNNTPLDSTLTLDN